MRKSLKLTSFLSKTALKIKSNRKLLNDERLRMTQGNVLWIAVNIKNNIEDQLKKIKLWKQTICENVKQILYVLGPIHT